MSRAGAHRVIPDLPRSTQTTRSHRYTYNSLTITWWRLMLHSQYIVRPHRKRRNNRRHRSRIPPKHFHMNSPQAMDTLAQRRPSLRLQRITVSSRPILGPLGLIQARATSHITLKGCQNWRKRAMHRSDRTITSFTKTRAFSPNTGGQRMRLSPQIYQPRSFGQANNLRTRHTLASGPVNNLEGWIIGISYGLCSTTMATFGDTVTTSRIRCINIFLDGFWPSHDTLLYF